MTQRTTSNPSLIQQYDEHISRNMGKVKEIGERLSALGETLEDYKRKNILACELLVIIQQTIELQRKQSELFTPQQKGI